MKSIVNIGKLLVSIACVGALTTSCNSDFLDRPPLGTLDEVTYLSTKDAGYKLLVNCYQPLQDSWNYQDMKFVLGDQLSDDCSKGGSDAGDAFVSRKSPAEHQWRLIKSCPTFGLIATKQRSQPATYSCR